MMGCTSCWGSCWTDRKGRDCKIQNWLDTMKDRSPRKFPFRIDFGTVVFVLGIRCRPFRSRMGSDTATDEDRRALPFRRHTDSLGKGTVGGLLTTDKDRFHPLKVSRTDIEAAGDQHRRSSY